MFLPLVFFIYITECSGLKATEVQCHKQIVTAYANGWFKLIISQRNKNPLFTIPGALLAAIQYMHHTRGNLSPLKLCRISEMLLLWWWVCPVWSILSTVLAKCPFLSWYVCMLATLTVFYSNTHHSAVLFAWQVTEY